MDYVPKTNKNSVFKGFIYLLISVMVLSNLFIYFQQPNKAIASPADWQIKSVDTQIISKCWNNVPQSSIDSQVQMLKGLGVNYIAIGTPYDRPQEMEKWVDSIHNAGIKVWFRSHWLNWEGDEGQPKDMSSDTYLAKTKQFIVDHPSFFKLEDSFTMNVEAENAGVANGGPFPDWDSYNDFLRKEIDQSNDAFAQIGLSGRIKTNWLSMNGWIIENALEQSTVDKMGIITPDHYSPQGDPSNPTPISKLASDMSADLDRFYAKWNKPIMIGEWGYHIGGDVSDDLQKQAVEAVYNVFASKSYIFGVSYWDHMGNQTKLINDQSGTPTTLRPSADVIKSFFAGITTPTPEPPTPAPVPAPSGTSEMLIANFNTGIDGFVGGTLANRSLELKNPTNNSTGARKDIGKISLASSKYLEFDIDLKGNRILPGDASAVYFEQGGWKWVSLLKYVSNGKLGLQHVKIPLSDMGLDTSSGAAYLGFRFWNDIAGTYSIDNIMLTNDSTQPAPAPGPTPAPTTSTSKIISDFENGLSGWGDGAKMITGYNSVGAMLISNPANGSSGGKKSMNGTMIGDYNYIDFDLNLNGNKILLGDASALYFDQGGWKWISISKYVTNSQNGWQHISIPLSDFSGLDRNSGLATIGFRFWNTNAGNYSVDNVSFVKK